MPASAGCGADAATGVATEVASAFLGLQPDSAKTQKNITEKLILERMRIFFHPKNKF
ncbi:hypothetical protein [Collimonas humicola]|uniref:hypothetical protein n=1 Tax=Collimonas humicola TaxID=2825886 RepID=UPI001B8AAA61|nr:hypothetical protein [Collimonas humicola]